MLLRVKMLTPNSRFAWFVHTCDTLVPRAWFMEGKEGKEYKASSLHQIMRRLGFFPNMRSSAGISKLGTEKHMSSAFFHVERG